MRLPGWMPATDEMNTSDDPSASAGSAARAVSMAPRRLTLSTRSHASGVARSRPWAAPMPTL